MMDGWMNGKVNRWMDKWIMDGWMNGRVNEWMMDGWMNGRVNDGFLLCLMITSTLLIGRSEWLLLPHTHTRSPQAWSRAC